MPNNRELEALLFRVLSRLRVPPEWLPRRRRPVLMRDIHRLSLERHDALAALRNANPGCELYLDEFGHLWDNEILDVAIAAHAEYGGEWAGTGPVDFIEGWTLYSLVRERRPARVLEIGFAYGISSWIIAAALERNGAGELDTVDVEDSGDSVPRFRDLVKRGIIHPHCQDGAEFARATPHEYELTFSDALHTLDFNRSLAEALRSRWPRAVHCYHEWSLSPLATSKDSRYVSMRVNLASCGERQAFEESFAGYRHLGIPSSSGLGIVLPA